MRLSSARRHALRPLLVAAIVCLACPWASADQPPAAPVQSLFNGTSFAGWNGDTKHTWRIEDGAIVAGSPTAPAPQNEFLATNRTFGDFELRLEYRLDCVQECNAGIQFRTVRIPNHHEVIGYQADIGPAVDGGLYDESRRNAFLVKASQEAVAQAFAKAKNGWNEYVVRCEGRRIRLSINGVETVDYTETDPTIPQEGTIALQIHGKMVGTVRYRNIRIQEFLPLLASDFRLAAAAARAEPRADYDVVIYGGTSGAVTAAVQAAAMGARVVLVSPDRHLGGLSSGGLGYTDSGKTQSIGGLAREFYRRVYRHYADDAAWKWQPRAVFRNLGQGVGKEEEGQETMWLFEPHVAERIFDQWVKDSNVIVEREMLLDRKTGVDIERSPSGPRITAITTLPRDGAPARTLHGKVFIDATYEGDLMAAAGVAYHVGRESNATYGEEHNGNQVGVLHHGHHFNEVVVDPYRVPGDPASGLLPRISADPPGTRGEGDHRMQAYCFRMCLTNVTDNRVPFPKPVGYEASQYELLARTFAAGLNDYVFEKFDGIPNGKTDTNNHGPFSTDNIGMNYDYPDASYERRREIIREHEIYQQGLMWFLCHDERVPEKIRDKMNAWGLPKDEFLDNGHWPHQLYIREARRMIGEEVMTENHVLGKQPVARPVGMGSYTLDSHNVRRYVIPAADGRPARVQNEGDIGVHVPKPYAIGYGCLVPKREQCTNLLVPVCMSASHIAYGSIRMEPVFMLLGQSAATAAVIAARDGITVQEVPYDRLRERLLADGQRLAP